MDRLLELLSFDRMTLVLTGASFWIFFLLVYVGFAVLHRQKAMRTLFLLGASWFFYYKAGGSFVALLIVSTVVSYLLGLLIHRSPNQVVRRASVSTGIVFHLFMLGYYKYSYFFTDTVNSLFGTSFKVIDHFAQFANQLKGDQSYNVTDILLPLGISFYTFKIISYLVDLYRRDAEPAKNIYDYALYLSFFPSVVLGPITRAKDFLPQLYAPTVITKQQFGHGVWMILKGLFKKLVIADFLAVNFVNRVFDNPSTYTGFEHVSAIFNYSVQLYCDFSGYTDIAIGLAALMGFVLKDNFNSPYKAVNVSDFWRRWHISLSSFLKDYLYIPLGGNRHGKFRTEVNLMVTMLLGGLWHGASWNFVIWGGLNGLGLLVYKNWKKISPYEKYTSWPAIAWKVLLTFSFITFTRIFFRCETMADVQIYFHQVTHNFAWELIPQIIWSYKAVFAMFVFGLILHWLPYSWKAKGEQAFIDAPLPLQMAFTVFVVIIIYQSISADMVPFIYQQF